MAPHVSSPSPVLDYPDSDGLPMAESDFQRTPLIYAITALSLYFQARPDVYVSGNLFMYYEEGNPAAVVAPDVFVVLGTTRRDRSSYKLWEEPKGPDFVLEITSQSSHQIDQGHKRQLYAHLGVREYLLYDPTDDYLAPPLQGFRLVGEQYEPMAATALPTGGLGLSSAVLGLEVRVTQEGLRFYDPRIGQRLLTPAESEAARQQAEQAQHEAEAQARREAAARQAAEARVAALEATIQALQAQGTTPPPGRQP